MNYHAKFVEAVTTRVIDDGDLSVLDQFFKWDGDWNLLHEMPVREAYAVVKLVIRSGYDFRVRGFNDCINVFPHMITAFFHSGMKFTRSWNMWPYSVNIVFIRTGCHVLEEGGVEFVKNALSACTVTVGDVLDNSGCFSDYCVVEYSFMITVLIERGLT